MLSLRKLYTYIFIAFSIYTRAIYVIKSTNTQYQHLQHETQAGDSSRGIRKYVASTDRVELDPLERNKIYFCVTFPPSSSFDFTITRDPE